MQSLKLSGLLWVRQSLYHFLVGFQTVLAITYILEKSSLFLVLRLTSAAAAKGAVNAMQQYRIALLALSMSRGEAVLAKFE